MSRRNGKIGSFAKNASTNKKTHPRTADVAKSIQTIGFVQGTFWPPRSSAIKEVTIVKASDAEPKKSMRRKFLIFDSVEQQGRDGAAFRASMIQEQGPRLQEGIECKMTYERSANVR